MFDCSKDVQAYHSDEVTLRLSQRTEMRDRRDANRTRLKSRISILPDKIIKQGSYAMKTMVQDADNDYDIDDGVYFTKESLQDENGNDMEPEDARQMLCDALQDDRFNRQPKVRTNCARIYYNDGSHVDMPVYRINAGDYELAAGNEWVHSRAADVEEWFDKTNQDLSPDTNDGRQFRRIVRLLKKFARSRNTWKDEIATGFTITKLAAEEYVSGKEREDRSLRSTMQAMYTRLASNLEVEHPVTPNAFLTKGPNDSSTAFLRDKLKDALEKLDALDEEDCDREKTLKSWDSVFNTTFFSERLAKTSNAAASGILSNLVATKQDPKSVDKRGGGRFA